MAKAGPADMSTAILIRVDQSGGGDFKKIQDGIDAIPSNNSELFFIWVKPGTYRLILLTIYNNLFIFETFLILMVAQNDRYEQRKDCCAQG